MCLAVFKGLRLSRLFDKNNHWRSNIADGVGEGLKKTKQFRALVELLRASVRLLHWQREPICKMAARRLIARQRTHHIGTFAQT